MFQVRMQGGSLFIMMAASLSHVDQAAWALREFLEGTGHGSERFSCELGLREALLNAVIHGAGEDDRRPVNCLVELAGDEIIMRIHDGGGGFCRDDLVSDPPAPDVENGRGLLILTDYFDAVQFNAQGNCITLRKTLEGGRGDG